MIHSMIPGMIPSMILGMIPDMIPWKSCMTYEFEISPLAIYLMF